MPFVTSQTTDLCAFQHTLLNIITVFFQLNTLSIYYFDIIPHITAQLMWRWGQGHVGGGGGGRGGAMH